MIHNGNVGIGTTSPDKPLHIKHGGGAVIRIETTQGDVDGATNYIEWHDSVGQKAFVGDGSGDNKTFHIWNNRGHVFVGGSSTTNVGIGNQTPSYKLDVSGDINFTGTLRKNGVEFGGGGSGSWTTSGSDVYRSSGKVGIGTSTLGNFKLHIYNSTGTNTNGSNLWHNHFCVEEQTMAGSGITFKAGTQTGYIYYGSSTGNPWVGTGSFGFATTATGNSSDIKMVLKKNGRVGIGTLSPDGKLHAVGSSGVHALRITGNSGNNGQIYATGSNYGIRIVTAASSGSYYSAYFEGSSGKGLYVRDDGNVGIGTTTPGSILELSKSVSTEDDYTLMLNFKNTYSSYYDWSIGPYSNNGNAKFSIRGGADGFNNLNNYFTVHGNGNVGIGTTDPLHKLHVANLDISNNMQDLICLETQTSSEAGHPAVSGIGQGILFKNKWYTNSTKYSMARISAHSQPGYGGQLSFWTNYTAGTSSDGPDDILIERLRINANGNVGIGTTDPKAVLNISANQHQAFSYSGLLRLHQTADGGHGIWGHISLPDTNTASGDADGGYYFIGRGQQYSDKCLTLHVPTAGSIDMCSTGAVRMMKIQGNGNVGIGPTFKTTSPQTMLDIQGVNNGGTCLALRNGNNNNGTPGNSQILLSYMGYPYNSSGYSHKIISRHQSGTTHHENAIDFYLWKSGQGAGDIGSTHGMSISAGGVGIGTTTPGYPLHVAGSVGGPSGTYLRDTWALSRIDLNLIAILWSTGFGTRPVGLKVDANVWPESVLISSDERIKENIVDVSDNLALEMLRNIPVKYYEYKDKLNKGIGKTIGFIAQEVKEHLPMAVGIQPNIIPNEMRILTDISWNDTTLYTNLSDCSGVKYRFYVSNDISGNDECMKEVVGNSDNSFTFDQSWNHVFCYGKEVDDFHTLDKQKLFALNFSATQELDRQQQADKLRIAELEQEVNELKTIVHALKNHLGLS